jgi:hypothetical protein
MMEALNEIEHRISVLLNAIAQIHENSNKQYAHIECEIQELALYLKNVRRFGEGQYFLEDLDD